MLWQAPVEALAGALLALGFAGVHAWQVLPRFNRFAGAGITAGLIAAVLVAAALSPPWAASTLTGVALALLAGHLGWAAGRRPIRRREPQRSGDPAKARNDAPGTPNTAPQAAADGSANRAVPPSSASRRGSEATNQFGPYRIERTLGRGAMGAVYLAHDDRSGRQVAVKTLALGREFHGEALAEARRRFFREAETTARLRHDDIVAVFDAGEAGEQAYIAMEYVAGHDLLVHTRADGLLPLAVVAATIARVAEALAHAHRQGVIHRDVKPGNVMLDLATGGVKVTDFGIARVSDASRTRTGVLLGTPAYMSPEQMAGAGIDGRSDLYSLGVVLFQLLTGTLPHESESMAVLMRSIAHEPAPDVRSRRADLPEALARVLAKALEKRPQDRYADGTLLAAELRAACGADTVAQPAAAAESPAVAEVMPSADSVTFGPARPWERPDTRHNSPR